MSTLKKIKFSPFLATPLKTISALVLTDQLLQGIADYNEVDCVSTRLLRDWLLTLREVLQQGFDLIRVSTVNRLTGYDGYRILTSSNRLGNFDHSCNRLRKIEKKLAFSKIF